MVKLLLATFVVGSLAQCQLAANGTSCETASYPTCSDKCSFYVTESTCAANNQTGCRWTNGYYCSNPGATCYADAPCSNSNCSAGTALCKFKKACSDNGNHSCISKVAGETSCTSQSSCEWKDACVQLRGPCNANDDQPSCTATPGCFWVSGPVTIKGLVNTTVVNPCRSCFADRDKVYNEYTAYKSAEGQTCSNIDEWVVTFSTVVAAATGCTGGTPLMVTDNFQNCTGGAGGGTTVAPTSSPAADTSAANTAALSLLGGLLASLTL